MRQGILFEVAWNLLSQLPPPEHSSSRTCKVVPGSTELAVAKTADSRYELLFVGKEVLPRSPLIRECLTHAKWQDETDKKTFEASSLSIPQGDYSASIGALIIVEFTRLEPTLSSQEKFWALEPVIERFLQREMLTESETMGLLGELIVLREIISNVQPACYKRILEGWTGHRHVVRDFTFENISLEIKTTQSTESIHTVNSIGQIEARTDVNGLPLERLYLLSIGLMRSSIENSYTAKSLAQTCEEVVDILRADTKEADELIEAFLNAIAEYGVSSNRGYLHDKMQHHLYAKQSWDITFSRIYDMSDPALSIPRRETLNSFRNVVADSFRFEICLPRRVSGDLNPLIDLHDFCSELGAGLTFD